MLKLIYQKTICICIKTVLITDLLVCPRWNEDDYLFTCLPRTKWRCPGQSEDVDYLFTCLHRTKWRCSLLIHLSPQDEVKAAQGELNKHKDLLKARNKDITAAATEQRALQKESSAAQLKVQELQHKVTKVQKDSQDAARQVRKCMGGRGGGSIYLFSWSRTAAACILWFEIEVSFCTRSFCEPWSWKWSEQTASLDITLFNFYLRSLFWLRHFYNDLFVLFSCQICLFVCPFLIFIWDRYSHWDIFIMICSIHLSNLLVCVSFFFFLFSSFTTDTCGFWSTV